MNEHYRQCRLERKSHGGTQYMTSWLPDQFAKIGKVLKLRDDNKHWEDGWLVVWVSSTRREWEELDDCRLPERK